MTLHGPYTRYSTRAPRPRFLATLGEAVVWLFFVACALALIVAILAAIGPLELGQ